MIKKAILVLLVLAALMGCKAIGYDEEATASDIEGYWTLNMTAGTLCCAGALEYSFYSDYNSTGDIISGSGKCTSNGASFDYEFNNNTGKITIDGSQSANAGLQDNTFYVFMNGDKMAWELTADAPVTAYTFSKN